MMLSFARTAGLIVIAGLQLWSQSRDVVCMETDFGLGSFVRAYSDRTVASGLEANLTLTTGSLGSAGGEPFGISMVAHGEMIVALNSPGSIQLERLRLVQGAWITTETAHFNWPFGPEPTSMTFDRNLSQIIVGNLEAIRNESQVLFASTAISGQSSLQQISWSPIGTLPDYLPVARARGIPDYLHLGFRVFSWTPGYEFSGRVCLGFASLVDEGVQLVPDPALGTYSLEYYDFDAGHYETSMFVDWAASPRGSNTVVIRGHGPGTCQLLVNGTAYPFSFTPGSAEVTVTLAVPLQIGDLVVLLAENGTVHSAFHCPVFYDNPAGAPGRAFAPMPISHSLYIGNTDFVYQVEVATDLISSSFSPVDSLALFGFSPRIVGQSDPVSFTSLGWMLNLAESILLPVEGSVGPEGIGSLLIRLPIPNDPSLVGSVVFFQFAIDNAGVPFLSDIIGMMIQPAR